MTVVDTDVMIDFFRDISPAAKVFSELISIEKAAMTAISVFELYAGIEGSKRLRQIDTLVQEITVIPLNAIEAAIGGRIYTQLKLNYSPPRGCPAACCGELHCGKDKLVLKVMVPTQSSVEP